MTGVALCDKEMSDDADGLIDTLFERVLLFVCEEHADCDVVDNKEAVEKMDGDADIVGDSEPVTETVGEMDLEFVGVCEVLSVCVTLAE